MILILYQILTYLWNKIFLNYIDGKNQKIFKKKTDSYLASMVKKNQMTRVCLGHHLQFVYDGDPGHHPRVICHIIKAQCQDS